MNFSNESMCPRYARVDRVSQVTVKPVKLIALVLVVWGIIVACNFLGLLVKVTFVCILSCNLVGLLEFLDVTHYSSYREGVDELVLQFDHYVFEFR
jgi:hypothetical protein